jgi:cation:H+ antiporter
LLLLSLLAGLAMLVFGADLLVRGGTHIALAFRVPVLIVGLTLVAFGTSTPELAVSLIAAFDGSGEIALANVNGSNIANILLVLGLSAVIMPLVMDRRMMRRELPALLLLQALVIVSCLDGLVSRLDGLLLLAVGVGYNVLLVRDALQHRASLDPEDIDVELGEPKPLRDIALFVSGLGVLVFGADLFIDGAVWLAEMAGMSDRVIGLTVVAVGTSAPEIATSAMSAWRGQSEMALGNAIGSNILNVAIVLGVTAMIAPIGFSDPGVYTDVALALGAALLMVPVIVQGSARMSRPQGFAFLGGYAVYVVAAVW